MVEKRFNNDRTEGLARFYLNTVHYGDYKEKFSDNSMKNEVIPAISSLKLDGGGDSGEQFKTPIASKKVKLEKKKKFLKSISEADNNEIAHANGKRGGFSNAQTYSSSKC